jgi:hypothetical protein
MAWSPPLGGYLSMPERRKDAAFIAPSPPRRVEMGGEIKEEEVDEEERRVEAEAKKNYLLLKEEAATSEIVLPKEIQW